MACDLLGAPLYELVGLGSSRFELEEMFGLPVHKSRKVAWTTAGLCCKNWNQRRFLKRFGLQALSSLVDWAEAPDELTALRRRKQPVLLVSWHSGVPYGVAAGLWKSGLEAMFCVGPPPPFRVPEGLIFLATHGGGLQRTEALHRSLRCLREGGMVYVVADHPTYNSNRFAMWDREVSLAPSIGMLARVSGASVVPVVSRWGSKGRIVLELGGPMEMRAGPEVLYRDLAAWFESYLRHRPEDLEPKFLMKLLSSPPVEEKA